MKRKLFLLCVVVLFLNSFSLADRPLEKSEILKIFEQLTAQPKNTWISSGTIEASHEEFRAAKTADEGRIREAVARNVKAYQAGGNRPEKADYLQKQRLDAIPFNTRYELSNEYKMTSVETVRFDGERFYWEINIQSRDDSVKPHKGLYGNEMTDQFNMELNARKIYAWDGYEYVKYWPLAEHASVNSAVQSQPKVNGPLTAGLIPWGTGYFSYNNLAAMQFEAVERNIEGNLQITLVLTDKTGMQMSFALDPAKNYAVLKGLITGSGNTIISKEYSDYKNISGNWVPMFILLEKYDGYTKQLLDRDIWTINSIDENVPDDDDFEVDYEDDTLIEYISPISESPLLYSHSANSNTEVLLGEKLTFDAKQGTQKQNCATAAIKYVLTRLDKRVDDSVLVKLINESDNMTSLYDMKAFVQNLGLNCRAITTDIDTVKSLSNNQIILYLPEKKHFVALESIDQYSVRTIDFTSRKFYNRTDIGFFDMDWTSGIALVISSGVIKGDFQDIPSTDLSSIAGGAGYECARVLQEEDYFMCLPDCGGYYIEWHQRFGCQAAESGSCSTTWLLRYTKYPCKKNESDPSVCDYDNSTDYWMKACG